jgi:hypothetical protein
VKASLSILENPGYRRGMSDPVEDILNRVARGDLTPDQALPLLDAARGSGAPQAPPLPAVEPGDARSVRIRSSYRALEIVGDPTVARIHVTGEHSVTTQGDALVVSTPGPLDDDQGGDGARFSFAALPRTLNWVRSWRERQVQIRVNPDLPVVLELTGTELHVGRLRAGLSGRVTASALRLDDVEGVFDLEVNSSSVKGRVLPTGSSRLAAESSSVRLSLSRGADLVVEATNRMGKLTLPDGDESPLSLEGETRRMTVGSGRDRLVLDAVMSSVTLQSSTWAVA